MPVIYIDVLLALNLFIDFLLLSAVSRILRLPPKRIRLVLGAVAGSGCSCLLFLPALSPPASLIIKTICACAIVRIAFVWRGFMLYIKQLAAFLVASALFAGIAFAIWFFAAPEGFYVINGVVYYNVSPLMLTALTVVSYLAISLYDRLTHKRMALGQEYRLIIDCGGGPVGLRTLYDTGHHVTDVFSGSPVAVVRYGAVEACLPENLRKSVCFALDGLNAVRPGWKEQASIAAAVGSRLRLIPVKTVGGTSLLPAFAPPHMELVSNRGNADVTGAYIAVCKVLGRGEYDAIIGTDLVNLLERSGSSCRKR
jgi:stage II sporulation protein GA (sporulation sigma-E factor processing peptidase)